MGGKKILHFENASQPESGGKGSTRADSVNSRLAAILAADVEGYTRLVEQDTAATVTAWQSARDEVIDPEIVNYGGRVVKLTGDGFIAEFPTVQAAVECAIAMQDDLEPSPLKFRMGVSIGDIIDDGRDIHGEGINIAARLEALADPGGIFISGEVYNLVRNRIDEAFEDLGQQRVKNVSQPVNIYALQRFSPPDGRPKFAFEAGQDSGDLSTNTKGGASAKYAWSAGIILLLIAGAWFLIPRTGPEGQATSAQPSAEEISTLANHDESDAEVSQAGKQSKPLDPAQLSPGQTFSDCNFCPEMVVVPAGSFEMGWSKGDPDEKPVHQVTIPYDFAVAKFETTFNDWKVCVSNGGCAGYAPRDWEWGRDNRPVIFVSWLDAQTYVSWLRELTGKNYRLLSEAEWEYAALGGKTTMYPWGVAIDAGKANYGLFRNKTMPVGSYDPNAFGLYDVIGNVWEWVLDCYDKAAYAKHRDYPAPFLENSETCRRVLRGGAWNVDMSDGYDLMRTSIRWRAKMTSRYNHYGFRVARDLE